MNPAARTFRPTAAFVGLVGLVTLVLGAAPSPAGAWEAETTHAGLTEQAALAAGLHQRLTRAHGRGLGLFESLTVPHAGAEVLYRKLKLLSPTGGFVPDARGRQTALAWLLAGAVLEDVPPARGRHHFLDPVHSTGLTGRLRDAAIEGGRGLATALRRWITGGRAPVLRGMPANQWVLSPENELSLTRFWTELEASATAESPGERDRHLAFALLVAGAIAHVLEDVGSPSRARDDLAEHLTPLGGGARDRGSRFERLAALAHGKLGVPAPTRVERRARLADFFSTADGKGLADWTASSWFSSGTLPEPVPLPAQPSDAELARALEAPFPAPSPAALGPLDLPAARSPEGATLRNRRGVCVARYRIRNGRLSFHIDDRCALEQIGVILPEIGAYAAGVLEWLFRGELEVGERSVTAGEIGLGAGVLRFVAEDARGMRRPLGPILAVSGARPGAPLSAIPAAPVGTRRIVVVFRGKDAAGEELVAVGIRTLP